MTPPNFSSHSGGPIHSEVSSASNPRSVVIYNTSKYLATTTTQHPPLFPVTVPSLLSVDPLQYRRVLDPRNLHTFLRCQRYNFSGLRRWNKLFQIKHIHHRDTSISTWKLHQHDTFRFRRRRAFLSLSTNEQYLRSLILLQQADPSGTLPNVRRVSISIHPDNEASGPLAEIWQRVQGHCLPDIHSIEFHFREGARENVLLTSPVQRRGWTQTSSKPPLPCQHHGRRPTDPDNRCGLFSRRLEVVRRDESISSQIPVPWNAILLFWQWGKRHYRQFWRDALEQDDSFGLASLCHRKKHRYS